MPLIIIIFVLLAASLYFLFPQFGNNNENDGSPSGTRSTQAVNNDTGIQQAKQDVPGESTPGSTLPADSGGTADGTESEPVGPAIAPEGQDAVDPVFKEKADSITSFFKMLDSRDYIKAFNLGEESIVYFPALIQRLADNPPVVTGETDDLFTILQNTAHFFRIIGKKNILILKGILDREKDTFEQTLADFYELTLNPQYLEERLDISVTPDSIYLYSGFFLNTMGGRLYLFRRDSMSRMVVSFYAIQNIENANRRGKNRYGIEIKQAIDNLIEEIESSKINLKMRDHYLDTLYDLKEKYQ